MNNFLRVFFSGIFGFAIVIGLFLVMLKLISNDWPASEPTTTSVELVTYTPPVNQTEKLKPIEVQKKQREKPVKQQSPDLQLSDTGNIESGQGEQFMANSIGDEFGQVSANSEGVLGGSGGLNTDFMTKYYDHNVMYPVKAKQAGITQGYLIARAVFGKKHEFLQFEITDESHPGFFRGALFQLKFNRGSWGYHFYNPKYNVPKIIPKDADSIHHETFKFNFDLNSTEPVKMYRYGSFYQ